ncbi:hypothetical protein DFH09DRAFT_1328731 [Mycena vulgaris]|nr:hypothetical protein DFH09DRAFT_1328731 [Mycena vulgaris]
MPADSNADAPYGHILSSESTDLARDTFIFFILRGPARLILGTFSIRSTYFVERIGVVGVNQKLTPASSATRVHLMGDPDEPEPEVFYLCPVSVHSVSIMAYGVRPSGSPIDAYSTAALPPGNYG